MSITVKVNEAQTHFSDLLARVEAGEDVIIVRGNNPIARLSRIRREGETEAAIAEIMASRADRKQTAQDEIRAWRDESRRL